jgi:hypothetical protein
VNLLVVARDPIKNVSFHHSAFWDVPIYQRVPVRCEQRSHFVFHLFPISKYSNSQPGLLGKTESQALTRRRSPPIPSGKGHSGTFVQNLHKKTDH